MIKNFWQGFVYLFKVGVVGSREIYEMSLYGV